MAQALSKLSIRQLRLTDMDINSESVFSAQLGELGLASLAGRFDSLGWSTLGLFGFAVHLAAGGIVDPLTFDQKVIRRISQTSDDAEEPQQAAGIRRLLFQAHVAIVGNMRQKMDRTSDDALRCMPQPDCEAPKERLEERLKPGLLIEGINDPSDSTISLFLQMVDVDIVSWVPWEQCPTFHQEMDVQPTKRKWVPDSKKKVLLSSEFTRRLQWRTFETPSALRRLW